MEIVSLMIAFEFPIHFYLANFFCFSLQLRISQLILLMFINDLMFWSSLRNSIYSFIAFVWKWNHFKMRSKFSLVIFLRNL